MELSVFKTSETFSQLMLKRALGEVGGNRALSEKLNVNRATVQRWLRGEKKISASIYNQIFQIAYKQDIFSDSPFFDPANPKNWARRRRDGKPMFTHSSAKAYDARKFILIRKISP